MFDIGMSELLVVGTVALIVVGPKDLPGMFRTLGRFTAKAKAMGREFSRAMEAAADESGMKDVGNTIKAASNPKKFGLDALDGAADRFEKWDPMSTDKAETPPPELDPERAEMARKISENAAKKATERKARKAAEASEPAKRAVKGKPAEMNPTSQKAVAEKAEAAAKAAEAKAAGAGDVSPSGEATTDKPAPKKRAAPKAEVTAKPAAKKAPAKKTAAKATTKAPAKKAASKTPATKTAATKTNAKPKKGEA